jgi:hypothetical protein
MAAVDRVRSTPGRSGPGLRVAEGTRATPPDSWIYANIGTGYVRLDYWRDKPMGRPDAIPMEGGGWMAMNSAR